MSNEISSYYNNANQSLFENIPQGLSRVLEFGCSGGALGEQYKQANPNTIWHGVDIFKPAVDVAQGRIDGAWAMDANAFTPNKAQSAAPYDAIIYGDVIEHLIDPVKSLPDQLTCLKPDGLIIACIPNVQHWTVMRKVLAGQWNYQPHGILDNTHLRFFTRDSIQKLLNKIGFEQSKLVRYSYENKGDFAKPETIKARTLFLSEMERFNAALGLPFNEYDFRTFQYVIQAHRQLA